MHQCTNKKLNIDTINQQKVCKTSILDYLTFEINDNSINLNREQIESVVRVASRVLRVNIAVIDKDNNGIVICKEYLDSNENLEEFVNINKEDNHFELGGSIRYDEMQRQCVQRNIMRYKSQDSHGEKLKNSSVKELRNIAKDIGIDIVNTHTGKLFTKGELKLLIEAQLK